MTASDLLAPAVGTAGPSYASTVNDDLTKLQTSVMKWRVAAGASEADMNAVIVRANGGGGRIELDPGDYAWVGPLTTITRPGVEIVGSGSFATRIAHSGTGDLFKFQNNPFTVEQSGSIRGMTITGTSSANAVAIHVVDTSSMGIDDIVTTGYTGTNGTGILLENVLYWTERTVITRCHLDGCKRGIRFKTPGTSGQESFGRTMLQDVRVNVLAGQVGIQTNNNAYVYSSTFNVSGNMTGAGKVFEINNSSHVDGGRFKVNVEGDVGGGGIGIHVALGAALHGVGEVRCDNMVNQDDNGVTGFASLRIMGSAANIAAAGTQPWNTPDAGSITNYRGTGQTANVIPRDGDSSFAPYASWGVLTGVNIASWYSTVYNVAGNGWMFMARTFNGTINASSQVFYLGIDGKMTFFPGASESTLFWSGANVLKTGGSLLAAGNFGCASETSAVAGTLVRRAVFKDPATNLTLGYIHIYDS